MIFFRSFEIYDKFFHEIGNLKHEHKQFFACLKKLIKK